MDDEDDEHPLVRLFRQADELGPLASIRLNAEMLLRVLYNDPAMKHGKVTPETL
jgi:hypothetical protein